MWVDTWVSTPQPGPEQLPPPSLAGGTGRAGWVLRQTVRTSVGGPQLRLCLSNRFGGAALPITAVSVALPRGGLAGVRAIQAGTARPVSFGGRPSVVVPAGEQVVSDPAALVVAAGSNVAVTLQLASEPARSGLTSHPGSRTTSYLLAGDQVAAADLPGATPVDSWYFLCGVQVPARPGTAVAVLVGDSLTDGRGTTTNRNNRWPDLLFDRLQADPVTRDVAVLNHGVGGSRLLDDGDGPGSLDRLIRRVLARPARRWLVVFKGINDIGTAAATGPAQHRVAADLVAAYDRIVTGVGVHGVQVYGATLPPVGGHSDYDDPAGFRDAARQQVNQWIRRSGRFDQVLDFDRAVRDPDRPRQLAAALDEGDHLHLNPAGYRALASAVPTGLFHRA